MKSTEEQFLTNINKLWDLWNLRVCVLLSLSLQAFLLLCGSMRQRHKSIWLHMLICSTYLLADWIAAFALGQIIQSPGDVTNDSNTKPNQKRDLYLFWAQFFLLHLGGCDSITSLSVVDNGFWLRQLLGVLLQLMFTSYSFLLLILSKSYKLWLPTTLVFLVGFIKCSERVNSLVIGSFDKFGETLLPKPNPGTDYEEAAAEISPITSAQVVQNSDTELNDLRLLEVAFSNFKVFKVLFAGFFVSFKQREKSREFFLELNFAKAFRLIEFELVFLHDLLHTKAAMKQSRVGQLLRMICFCFILCASILFFKVEKHGYDEFDAYLTYGLHVATIVIDIISIIKQIFSHWTFIRTRFWSRNCITTFILKQKRWSRSVFQHDMINYCLKNRREGILYRLASFMFLAEGLDKMRVSLFSSLVTVTKELEEFIFDELRVKSENASDLKDVTEACSQRGLSALLRSSTTTIPNPEKLKWSIEEFHYMESLLLWHLATELCCRHDQQEHSFSSTENEHKRICKLLSDYIFYLMVTQPKMLHRDFGNLGIPFQDTRAEAQRFFLKHSISRHEEVCKKLISVKTPCRASQVKGNKSKSLLFDACFLAKDLIAMEQQRWELMARVWVELMCFAAINCPPDLHAQQPSKGGELLTHVWLLLNHLGLGTQFSEQEKKRVDTPDVSRGHET